NGPSQTWSSRSNSRHTVRGMTVASGAPLRTVDVVPMLAQIVEVLRPQAATKQLTMRLAIPAHVPRIHADAERLRQGLLNLVANAIKHTPAGTVRMSVRAMEDILHFEVHDTAMGMTPCHKTAAFPEVLTGSRGSNATDSWDWSGTLCGQT